MAISDGDQLIAFQVGIGAMTEFQSILATDPNASEAHLLLAEALDGIGRTNDAIHELETVSKLALQQPVLHFELGYLYYKNRDYVHAVPELQLEVKNNPGCAERSLLELYNSEVQGDFRLMRIQC